MSTTSPADRKAAKIRADLARTWTFDEPLEQALRFRDRDPAGFGELNANHRSMVGYYEAARDAAKAAGLDISGGAR